MSGAISNPGAALTGDAALTGGQQLESWAGEARLNLVRLAAILLFYGYHLINVFIQRDNPELAGTYHVTVTALVMVWSAGVVVLWLYLARRWMPAPLMYVVSAWDTLLITTLLVLAGGPQSPLLILYFLVIAAAPLRLALSLVYAATLMALAAYGFLLGHYVFYTVGAERYYATASLQVPRTQEAVFALGLVAAGILAGQVVRQAKRLLVGQAATTEAAAARDAEVRLDTKLVAGGLVLAAVEVALGLLFSLTAGPASLGTYTAWPMLAVLAALFVGAVAAAVMEASQAGARPRETEQRAANPPEG
jgi:hypothetical protein